MKKAVEEERGDGNQELLDMSEMEEEERNIEHQMDDRVSERSGEDEEGQYEEEEKR